MPIRDYLYLVVKRNQETKQTITEPTIDELKEVDTTYYRHDAFQDTFEVWCDTHWIEVPELK